MLSRSEVSQLMESLKELAIEQFPEDGSDTVSLEVSDLIPIEMESIDLESFLMWAVKRDTLKHLLDMLHQVRKNNNINYVVFYFLWCTLSDCVSCVTSFSDCGLAPESKKET